MKICTLTKFGSQNLSKMMHRFRQRNLCMTQNVHVMHSYVRHASTTTPRRPTVRELFRAPIIKSVILTVLFGSAVVELIKQRRELEGLKLAHQSKFAIYEDIIEKLKRGEKVDLAHDLKIASTLTKHKYNTVNEIEMDEQLSELFNFDEEDEEEVVSPQSNTERSLLKFL